MSGRKSRRKGNAGELEVLHMLQTIWPEAHTTRNACHGTRVGNSCDIGGVPLRVEVKRMKKPNIRAALRQAEASPGDMPPVAFTRADRDEWVVSMLASAWLDMVHRAELMRVAQVAADGSGPTPPVFMRRRPTTPPVELDDEPLTKADRLAMQEARAEPGGLTSAELRKALELAPLSDEIDMVCPGCGEECVGEPGVTDGCPNTDCLCTCVPVQA